MKNPTKIIKVVFAITAFYLCIISGSCSDDEEVKFEVPIECNGTEVGMILEIEFSEMRNQSVSNPFRGANVRLGLDLPNGKSILDECCRLRTWRNWTKPSVAYNKRSPMGSITVWAGQWNEDFDPNDASASSNLPSRKPNGSNDEVPFESIFQDVPRATNEEIEVEFITCYGCVNYDGLGFRPLACFSWSYEADGDDIELDGFDTMDLDEVRRLNLPRALRPQNVPPEPF